MDVSINVEEIHIHCYKKKHVMHYYL